MSRTFAAIAALTLMLSASAASAQMLKTADTAKGKTFVDAKGRTLSTFDKDAGGKSMCNGPCAEKWPALLAADDAKPAAGPGTDVEQPSPCPQAFGGSLNESRKGGQEAGYSPRCRRILRGAGGKTLI